jgi:hypothetical protein
MLHQGIRYEERGPAVSHDAKRVRARKMIRELRSPGNEVELAASADGVRIFDLDATGDTD